VPQKDLAEYEFQFFPKEGDYWPEASGDELQPTYQPNDPLGCAASSLVIIDLLPVQCLVDILHRGFVPDNDEESLKGLNRSFLADPEETGHRGIDLVNQRQVLVALGVLDLIDSDGVDRSERAMRQSEGDNVLDSIEDLIP
jgi:hypothetical protein